jgi:hypothetical protein
VGEDPRCVPVGNVASKANAAIDDRTTRVTDICIPPR